MIQISWMVDLDSLMLQSVTLYSLPTVYLQLVAAASILTRFNKVTELWPSKQGQLVFKSDLYFKSLLHTGTCWYLNATFLSVDIIGHF